MLHLTPANRMPRLALIVAVFVLAGCSSTTTASTPDPAASTPSATPSPIATVQRDGATIANDIKQPTTTQLVTITAANDPNGKIGTATGYVSAAVLYDSGVACDTLGVDCGATIEVYSTADLATARAEYIKALGGVADEVDTVSGAAVLRATGKLPAATATAYATAFSRG